MNGIPIYPTGVIPGLLGKLHDRYGNTPKDAAILGPCLNGACSLVTSGVAKVERDEDGLPMVISGSHIAIAPSSSGKSFHFRKATNPIKTWEAKKREIIREERYANKAERYVFDGKISAIKRKLGEEYVNGGNVSPFETSIRHLVRHEPTDVTESALMQSNVTGQALLRQLARHPLSGLMTDEGNQVLDKISAEEFSTINLALDGEPMTLNRVVTGVVAISNPVMTVALTTQNDKFQKFLMRDGKEFNTSGLGPRSLCSISSESWVGTENIIPDSDVDREIYKCYTGCCDELLDQMDMNVRAGMMGFRVLKHCKQAKTRLAEFRRLTSELQRSGKYPGCSGFIGKMADQVMRQSACWHMFDGIDGDISSAYTEAAIQLVMYHLEVHCLLHAQPKNDRDEVRDADFLLDILYDIRGSGRSTTRSDLRNLAINKGISSRSSFDKALGLLGSKGKVHVSPKGRIHLILPEQAQGAHDTDRGTVGHIAQQPNMSLDRFTR